MDIIEINNLRKRAQRTNIKRSSEILFGNVRHSEVSHFTVTRIVGSYTECQKRVQTYKADLNFTLDNIKRQKHQLRRTLVQYGRKLRQNRKEREEREQEKVKKEAENKEFKLPPIFEESQIDEYNRDEESESNTETAEPDVMDDDDSTGNKSSPDIIVDDELQSQNVVEEEKGEKETETQNSWIGENTETNTEQCAMEKLTDELKEFHIPFKLPDVSTDPEDFGIEMYSKKKRKRAKQNVSYSDIIKLRHSTNTKKLFTLVDKLSKVHSQEEKLIASQSKSDQKSPEPARRGSMFYIINYGYDAPPDEKQAWVSGESPTREKEKVTENVPVNAPTLPYNNLFSEADNQFWRKIHKARVSIDQSETNNTADLEKVAESKADRRRRRASDLPLLVSDYHDIRNRSVSLSNNNAKKHQSAKLRQKLPRLLPPITRGMKF